MELHSVSEKVIVHYKDNKRCGVTFFNGHAETHPLDEPMGRKEFEEFFETNKSQQQ
jgi:hypothetical protein